MYVELLSLYISTYSDRWFFVSKCILCIHVWIVHSGSV